MLLNYLLFCCSNDTGYDGCTMYDYNYTAAVDMGYEAALANSSALVISDDVVSCLTRDFNHSQYESTVVTEVGLLVHTLLWGGGIWPRCRACI